MTPPTRSLPLPTSHNGHQKPPISLDLCFAHVIMLAFEILVKSHATDMILVTIGILAKRFTSRVKINKDHLSRCPSLWTRQTTA